MGREPEAHRDWPRRDREACPPNRKRIPERTVHANLGGSMAGVPEAIVQAFSPPVSIKLTRPIPQVILAHTLVMVLQEAEQLALRFCRLKRI